ncbi:sigma factor [Hymenobacter weizhouensis]|uniref:sigma factor n=1 Tax=Hymenobacter sp. YIM 151500-1 TaxID=2987689 RepID=UPI0022262D41|nr:sigma factor [Hymenobacter sp. YIM 151500-1]UYZ61774.1 RNA polymerase subunit sigma-70 [Hymenobacter sp. YIM 151500-1]
MSSTKTRPPAVCDNSSEIFSGATPAGPGPRPEVPRSGPAEPITELRGSLFAFAYRLTGHAADSEDLVQEVLANWFAANHDHVADPRRYLLRAVKNGCLTLLAHRPRRATGTELPEPLVHPRYALDAGLDVSFGLWLTLATLSPLERAVLLLKESFAYEYEELAELLDIRTDYCRQLYHRGQQRLRARQPRFQPSAREQQRLLTAFRRAVTVGDLSQLVQLLRHDVTIYADGGPRPAARRPIYGPQACGRYLLGLYQKFAPGLRAEVALINNSLGLLLFEPASTVADTVVLLEHSSAGVAALYIVRDATRIHL